MIELGIVAGGTALTGLILCLAIYKSSGQSSFLYSNARIVSRATYILDKNKLEELSGLKSLQVRLFFDVTGMLKLYKLLLQFIAASLDIFTSWKTTSYCLLDCVMCNHAG